MEVELYVYDLSGGLARQYSLAVTGVQIEAIYHTAVVFNNVEYFFGQGIHRKMPGSTHHGRPIKIMKLGVTELPPDVIEEYIGSLESIYTAESYDLFLHNCNNFSQDMAMFLVGQSIPDEIRSLPETFLKTPIGQMLRGQIDQSMRRMTQAPDAVAGKGVPSRRTVPTKIAFFNGSPRPERVHNVTSTSELDDLLQSARSRCAVIFFTSVTCPPCKIVYPAYDRLAEEAGQKVVLIKVDISKAYDVATRYQVRATPTFMTFLKGKKDDEWSGANEAKLMGNVRLLVQTAQHPHVRLRLPSIQSPIEKPIIYDRPPPLEKLLLKLGPAANDTAIQDLVNFIRTISASTAANAPLPDLGRLGYSFASLSPETHFALIDLVRTATADPRVASYLATEDDHKTLKMLIPTSCDYSAAPYNIQAVSLQLACNLWSSTIFQESLLDHSSTLRPLLQNLASTCLLSKHPKARSLSAALVYNLAAIDHNERVQALPDLVDLSDMTEVKAALVSAVVEEDESTETLHALLLALGLCLYCAPTDSSVWELCEAMEVQIALEGKGSNEKFKNEPLIAEIGQELLGRGGK